MSRRSIFGLALFVAMITLGCDRINTTSVKQPGVPPDSPEVSKYKNGVYSNSQLGLRARIPEKWVLVNPQTAEEMSGDWNQAVQAAGQFTDQQIAESQQRSLTLLDVSQRVIRADTRLNAIFTVKLQPLPEQYSVDDYLDKAVNLLTSSYLPIDLIKAIHTVELNGHEWRRVELFFNNGRETNSIWFVCTERDGYVLSLSLRFHSDQQRQVMEDILNSIELEPRR